ncbi:3-phosphoglycerate dehydrogenase [Flavobacteriaceae bacterium Ap0902]|nr:3-phosphoglycerate dehydrogenase [Flavobacteriaceae bacterium Ap0902]
MKILANDGIATQGLEILTENGFEVINEHIPQEELADFLNENNIDAILVRSATEVRQELIEMVPSLKLIGRAGVGMDNIDVDYAREMGLHVINTATASSKSVAELVFAHMFTMARFLHDSNRNMPLEGDLNFVALKKSYQNAIELNGKTLGIIGLGRVGKEVAKIGLALGMRVIGADSSDTDGIRTLDFKFPNGQDFKYKIEVKKIEEILKVSDFVSLHLPAQHQYIISREQLDMMKDGAFLINTSRGGIVDEVALIEALETGKLSAAALDVFENEPTPEIQILMHPKISLTPHIGGSTLEAQERIGTELAQQIIGLLNEDLY